MKGKLFNCSNGTAGSEQCFVIVDGGKHGYFVSAKSSDGPLVNGACVTFDLDRQERGPVATNIHILG